MSVSLSTALLLSRIFLLVPCGSGGASKAGGGDPHVNTVKVRFGGGGISAGTSGLATSCTMHKQALLPTSHENAMVKDQPLQMEHTAACHNNLLDARAPPPEGPAGASRSMMVLQKVLPQGYIIAEAVAAIYGHYRGGPRFDVFFTADATRGDGFSYNISLRQHLLQNHHGS